MSTTPKHQFVIEADVRVINAETGEVVDVKGYTDMRGKVKSVTTFSPMQATLHLQSFDDPIKAAAYMNAVYNVLTKVREIP